MKHSVKNSIMQVFCRASVAFNRCFDNARMESFFATLKKELLYRIPTYKMKMEEVKVIVFRYVFIYYNRIRIYTSNPDGLPPAAYRRRLEQPLAEAA